MELQQFSYQRPDNDRSKNLTVLCKTDRVSADMQLVKEGGENKLHSHTVSDGFFMVLQGSVKFYGEGDVVLAELGVQEGIVMPPMASSIGSRAQGRNLCRSSMLPATIRTSRTRGSGPVARTADAC